MRQWRERYEGKPPAKAESGRRCESTLEVASVRDRAHGVWEMERSGIVQPDS